jgi:hypothetical protein
MNFPVMQNLRFLEEIGDPIGGFCVHVLMVNDRRISSMPLSQQARMKRYFYCAIALTPIIGSFTLQPGISFLSCPLKYWVGIPCPAWGLTRGFIAIGHGHFNQATAYHLFSPVLFIAFLIATIHLLLELILNQPVQMFYVKLLAQSKIQVFLLLMLLGYHGSRVYELVTLGTLQSDILASPFGQTLFR